MNIIDKYEPIHIDDLLIEPSLKKILKNFISKDRIRILFYGNNGYDHSIIMNAIMNEYYKERIREENIFHIDTIKEQGINQLRGEIKTFCHRTLRKNNKRIIVIDNIELLTQQIQQIIRNTLDTYPNIHCVASCSTLNKVIENITSRLIPIHIQRIPREKIYEYIDRIQKNEGLELKEEYINTLITLSDGDIDLLNRYLEKLFLLKKDISFTSENIKSICSTISEHTFDEFTREWYINKNITRSIEIIHTIYNYGYSVIDILEYYFYYVKSRCDIENDIIFQVLKLLTKYISIFHTIHEDDIELQVLCYELCSLQ